MSPRPYRPNYQEREGLPLTIALGVLASDGWVLAADRQVTSGNSKWSHGKVSLFAGFGGDSGRGYCSTAGAGTPGYLRQCSRKISSLFKHNPEADLDGLQRVFNDWFVEFCGKHVIPFAGFPFEQRPGVDMVIAVERRGQARLWATDGNAIVDSEPYVAIGSGASVASPLLDRLYTLPLLTAKQSVMLAGYLIASAKETEINCGKGIDMVYLGPQGLTMIPRHITSTIEELSIRAANRLEPMFWRHVWGAGDIDNGVGEILSAYRQIMDDLP